MSISAPQSRPSDEVIQVVPIIEPSTEPGSTSNPFFSHPSHHTRTNPDRRHQRWWQIRWFRGMYHDLLRRAPYYRSDWTDAWDYRVVPATLYMYFTNILPALAFSLDMFSRTNMSYGVNEVLFSSVIASTIFSLFAAQPLVIVGVTGPITVFNYTVYEIIHPRGTDYFSFMCWIGLWSLIFHTILAVTNSCVALRYVTKLPCDTFGFFVAIVYLEKGVDVLIRQFPSAKSSATATNDAAYLSIVIALLTLLIADIFLSSIYRSTLFRAPIRKFVEDYGLPLTVVFLSGMVHVGKMRGVKLDYLPTNSPAFTPTATFAGVGNRTGWVIPFWRLSVGDIFLALPFGLLLTVLFWFDHNVSSLIAQASDFPIKKPAGFHWDIFLLGITTGLTGILGLPFPNGLIPQAPFHTQSLCVYPSSSALKSDLKRRQDLTIHRSNPEKAGNQADGSLSDEAIDSQMSTPLDHTTPIRVVEQRVSNLAQGLITLFTMSGPALIALRQIPQGVLAGLFFVMGLQALMGNDIVKNIGSLFQDPHLAPSQSLTSISTNKPLKCRKKYLIIFLFIELLVIGVSFGITHTVASIGFPLLFALLIPARHVKWLIPALIKDPAILAELDGPIASPHTLEGVYVDGDVHDKDNNAADTVPPGSSPSQNSLRNAENGIAYASHSLP